METVVYKLGEVLDNYDYLRKPLSSMERESFQGEFPYYGAQGIIDFVREYRCDGEYMLIAEDGENLMSRSQPIALIASGKFWVNNHAHIVKTNSRADMHYTCYALNHMDIMGFVTGSAQPKLSQGNLNRIRIAFPSVLDQQKIVAILSAYDKMIEINNKRIKVLEQMAENLYKEWFVRFRFPGHESAEFENGIPKGWDIKRIRDIVKRLPFGTLYKAENTEREGNIVVIDQSQDELVGYHNGEPSHIASIDNPIALFGDHSCKYQLMITPFSLSENVVPYIGESGIMTIYLYYLTHSTVETTEYKRHWTEFTAKKVFVAPEHLQKLFVEHVKPYIQMKHEISTIKKNLIKQRDLLLPRLMSGKLEV
ncbi:MAG: restriction endonuclease subunit S [Clostridia bacterium]|nr:restriction endonuclease subunit S [Clostridia bacterium]